MVPIVIGESPNLQVFTRSKANKSVIMHIINGLHTGGAEMMLYKLLSGMDRERFDARVISLIDGGEIRDKIKGLGIEVHSLGIQRRSPSLAGIGRLIRHLRRNPPDLIQTWMYHADLTGGVIGKLFANAPIVWNLRTSDSVQYPDNKRTLLTIKLCAFLSSFIPRNIISCSQVACTIHADLGYDASKLLTIPNGVELSYFQPDNTARNALREELKLPSSTPLVGMVARFHPQKDHANFIRAAKYLNRAMPDVQFVLCGDDITWENQQLVDWISEVELKPQFHLLGRRRDTPRVNAALNVATLSSAYGEGFPNVLVEAMACGVPCVTTDSGDASIIVGETGVTVPIRDPEALANGWLFLLRKNREEYQSLSKAARQRVIDEYSLPSVVARYEKLYSNLLNL